MVEETKAERLYMICKATIIYTTVSTSVIPGDSIRCPLLARAALSTIHDVFACADARNVKSIHLHGDQKLC